VKSLSMPASEYATLLQITRTRRWRPGDQGAVRVIEIDGIDIQPCGSTHVLNTEEIGRVFCGRSKRRASTTAGSSCVLSNGRTRLGRPCADRGSYRKLTANL
jgi:hypothetical protein